MNRWWLTWCSRGVSGELGGPHWTPVFFPKMFRFWIKKVSKKKIIFNISKKKLWAFPTTKLLSLSRKNFFCSDSDFKKFWHVSDDSKEKIKYQKNEIFLVPKQFLSSDFSFFSLEGFETYPKISIEIGPKQKNVV